MSVRSVPGTASIASPDGGKLFAPSAARNKDALCDLLEQVAPTQGHALEIASGTGQHIVEYATRLPDLIWQPTEVDAVRRNSIDAYVNEAELNNVQPAKELDATAPGWGSLRAGLDLIVLSNLLHLISVDEVKILLTEAATALSTGGRMVIYGPFLRDGALTSESDAAFHASLSSHDPEIGYKDVAHVKDWLNEARLLPLEPVEMPANNLCLISEKSLA